MRRPVWCFVFWGLAVGVTAFGQTPAPQGQGISATGQGAEPRATRAYEAAVRQGPPALGAFLEQFPKGADLHVHLSGPRSVPIGASCQRRARPSPSIGLARKAGQIREPSARRRRSWRRQFHRYEAVPSRASTVAAVPASRQILVATSMTARKSFLALAIRTAPPTSHRLFKGMSGKRTRLRSRIARWST